MIEIPIAYTTKLGQYKNNHNDYLEIPLPKKIEEIDELQPALQELHRIEREDLDKDKMNALFPTLITPDGEDEPAYIRIDYEPQDRHTLVIKSEYSSQELSKEEQKERERTKPKLTENLCYYMTFPTAFRDSRSDSPFQGFEKDDNVTLELDPENDRMRIYTPKDYRFRDHELDDEGRKPMYKRLTATGLSLNLVDQYTDPTGIGDAGQKFRLIPFKAQHRIFGDGVLPTLGGNEEPKFNAFRNVLKRGKIPESTVMKLTIKWSLDQTQIYSNDEVTGTTAEDPSQETIYTDYFVNEAKVILPCKGEFEITTATPRGTHRTWLTYSPSGSESHNLLVGDDWYTKYYQNDGPGDEFIIYAPCK